jgi:hypothetical protein
MRWLFGGIAAVIILIAVYLGSAVSSLAGLADAARAGDGASIVQRTDIKALTSSLSDQIVNTYLDRIGQKRQIKPMEKMLINTYGSGIADAMVARMLTTDNLAKILKTGKLDAEPGLPSFAGLPALGDLNTDNLISLLGRLRVVKPVQLAIRVSNSSDPDNYSAIDLHYGDLDWKLAGITLPKAILRELASKLPDR